MKVGTFCSNRQTILFDKSENFQVGVPTEDFLGVALPPKLAPIADPDVYTQAIRTPCCGESIATLVARRRAKSASILVSDATRAVPTSLVAASLVQTLLDAGIALENILFVVALGVHRDATQQEMRSFLGAELFGRVRIENHTPYCADQLVFLGTTPQGTPVEVYRRAYECDLHISIGKVEPHCFAGFSGGRKSVLPGISSARAIAANHTAANISHPRAVPGILEGNPVHEDMLAAAALYRLDFTVQFVVNDQLEPAVIFAGDPITCHQKAVSFLRKALVLPIPRIPDILVATTGQPKNIDFYQAVNSLAALDPILTEQTILVLACECPEGFNSPDMLRPFEQTDSLAGLERYMLSHYQIQMDCTLMILRLLKRKVKIIVCSPNLDERTLRNMYLIPCRDQKELMPLAYKLCGKPHPKVFFCPHPQKGLPVLSTEQ